MSLNSGSGIGMGVVITIVLTGCKLAGTIDWSWLFVLCPLLIDILLTCIDW